MSQNNISSVKIVDEPRIVTTSIDELHSPALEQNGVTQLAQHSSNKSLEQYAEKSATPDFVKNGTSAMFSVGGRTKINYKTNPSVNVAFKNTGIISNAEQHYCRYGCEKHCRISNSLLEFVIEMNIVVASVQFADKIYKRLKALSPVLASYVLFMTYLTTNFLNFFGPGLLYTTEFLVGKFMDISEDLLILTFLPMQKVVKKVYLLDNLKPTDISNQFVCGRPSNCTK